MRIIARIVNTTALIFTSSGKPPLPGHLLSYRLCTLFFGSFWGLVSSLLSIVI